MTPPHDAGPPPAPGLAQLALDKLTRVLGAEQGKRAFAQTLIAVGLTDLRTPNELYTFGEHLSKQGGFQAAVGRLLTVAAVIRGANNPAQGT